MKPYIQTLLIIAFALLCFVIGCNWSRVPSVEGDVKSDTIYIEGNSVIRIDTIYTQYRVYDPKPVKTVVIDSLHSEGSSTLCDSIREYTESLEDSSGLVVVESKVQGELIDQKISLQSYVTSTFRVDTLRITNTITKYKPIIAPFVEVQNSSYPLSFGIILGRNRTFIGAKVNQQGNFSGIFGYNLVK